MNNLFIGLHESSERITYINPENITCIRTSYGMTEVHLVAGSCVLAKESPEEIMKAIAEKRETLIMQVPAAELIKDGEGVDDDV